MLVSIASAFLLAASECGGGSGEPATFLQPAAEHPVYESGDLGSLQVPGSHVEARARFTLAADELPLAVIVDAEYVPAVSNPGPAHAEMWVYDSLGDQDPSNDVLAGALPMSGPFSRAALSAGSPGRFTIRVPLGSGSSGAVALAGGTWSVRMRVNTASWQGTITTWRLRVVTLKGAAIRLEPGCFVRD